MASCPDEGRHAKRRDAEGGDEQRQPDRGADRERARNREDREGKAGSRDRDGYRAGAAVERREHAERTMVAAASAAIRT